MQQRKNKKMSEKDWRELIESDNLILTQEHIKPLKTERVVVRLESYLCDKILQLAAKEERTVSAVLRQIIKKHFKVK